MESVMLELQYRKIFKKYVHISLCLLSLAYMNVEWLMLCSWHGLKEVMQQLQHRKRQKVSLHISKPLCSCLVLAWMQFILFKFLIIHNLYISLHGYPIIPSFWKQWASWRSLCLPWYRGAIRYQEGWYKLVFNCVNKLSWSYFGHCYASKIFLTMIFSYDL